MYKSAYANTPYKTPASIRGVSLAELHMQQKANDEMDELLSSNTNAAGAKAFSKGLAAGAVLPLVIAGIVPWATEVGSVYGDTRAQAELSALLVSKGVDEKAAPHHATTIHRYLKGMARMPDEKALQALRPSMKTYYSATAPVHLPTREAAEIAFREMSKKTGRSTDQINKALRGGAVREMAGPVFGKGVSQAQIAAVLEEAAKAFQKATTSSLPTFAKAHGIHAAKHLGRAAIPAAVVGSTAGIVSYFRNRKKQQTLRDLRFKQARRRSQHE